MNRSGLEHTEPNANGFLHAARLTQEECRHLCADWRCNVIRLPFNQDFALRGRRGLSAEDYLTSIDQAIDWFAAHGAYTLLDLQWLQADIPYGPRRQFIAHLPDDYSVIVWQMFARRYRDRPEVLYDLYTEPHDVSPEEWNGWAQRLADAVWTESPGAMVFVSGVHWGYDLREVGIVGENVVYSTHVYPNKGTSWDEAFGDRALYQPVFAAEWGCAPEDLEWGKQLVDYLTARGIGWTAWSWSDHPRISRNGQATPFGELVKAELA